MKAKTSLKFQDLPKDYPALCRVFLPRPIHDPVDYANVIEVADAMVLWNEKFTPDQSDYFDLLCTLIEEYDAKTITWPKASSLDILKHLMDEHQLTAADLSRILGGSRNLGAMILRGDRKLTLKHVRTLSRHFCVSADLLLA